jgi:hypothetical protein
MTPKRGFWTAYVLGVVTVAGLGLFSQPWRAPAALAQVPDSGAQRNEMIRELRKANVQLGEMTKLLKELRDLQKGGTSGVKPATRKP